MGHPPKACAQRKVSNFPTQGKRSLEWATRFRMGLSAVLEDAHSSQNRAGMGHPPKACAQRKVSNFPTQGKRSLEWATRFRMGLSAVLELPTQAKTGLEWATFLPAVLSRRPGERTASEQVHVEMKHRLPRSRTNIEHGSISLLDVSLPRNVGRRQMAAPDDLRVLRLGFFQSREMFLRDDQHVRRRLRVDVVKREDVVVLVNFFRRNLAANDAAKKAIGIAHKRSTCPKDNTARRTLSAARTRQRYFVARSSNGREFTFHVPSNGLSRSVSTKCAK